jgi:hypothetical protein
VRGRVSKVLLHLELKEVQWGTPNSGTVAKRTATQLVVTESKRQPSHSKPVHVLHTT